MVKRHPIDTIGKVIVGLRSAVDFSFEIGEDDINMLGVISGFAKERTAADVTK